MDLFSVVCLVKQTQVIGFTEAARVEQEENPPAVTELGFVDVPNPDERDPGQSLKRQTFDELEGTSASKRGRNVESFVEQAASSAGITPAQ